MCSSETRSSVGVHRGKMKRPGRKLERRQHLVAWLASLPGFAVLLPAAALALTPVDSMDLSPDVTITLDSQTIRDEDVASDDLMSGVITKPSLGPIPEAAELAGYHDLGSGEVLLVFETTVALPGAVTARPGDVVRYDGANYMIEFDASAESVPMNAHVDAVSVSAGGDLVLSFDTTVTLGGATYFDEDLIEFDGANFSAFFEGSAAGLDPALDVDGVHVFVSSGNLALSFDTSGSISGVDFDDEDVLEYDVAGTTWELAWDASVERSEWERGADVDAVHFVPEPSQFLMLAAGSGFLVLRRLQCKR
jgi:hypothetical protein